MTDSQAVYSYPGGELALFGKAQGWKRYLMQRIEPFLRGRVLEAGAGIGGMTPLLHTKEVTSITCLDPDEKHCHILRDKLDSGALPPGSTIVHGSLSALKAEERFDCILYLDVLEHIRDDRQELAQAVSHLTPGGRLIVLAPAGPRLYSAFDKALGHYRRYSAASLRSAVPMGMREEKMEMLDSLGLLAYSLFRLLRNSAEPGEASVLFWDRFLVPVSRITDRIIGFKAGKSVLGIWSKTIRE